MLEPVFTPEQITMLNTPLQPSEIESKQGMSYLKGQLAVIKANNIFGYGNWGYEQIGPIEMIETVTSNSNNKKVTLVTAMVKVTVRGCISFVEQGDCEAQGEGYASLSMARKGAVTDGLKRCLKNFGPTFGLELYFKTPPVQAASQPTNQGRPQPQQLPARSVTPPPPIQSPKEVEKISQNGIDRILSLAGSKGLDEIDLAKMSIELYGRPVTGLDMSEGRNFYQVLQGK